MYVEKLRTKTSSEPGGPLLSGRVCLFYHVSCKGPIAVNDENLSFSA